MRSRLWRQRVLYAARMRLERYVAVSVSPTGSAAHYRASLEHSKSLDAENGRP